MNSVLSCLQSYKENELFFLSLDNVTLDEMKHIGLEHVENSLIESIAHIANISVLRISNFMV